jgi:hypothetical protein
MGFQHMLRTHGMSALARVIGVTRKDRKNNDCDTRAAQIREWIGECKDEIESFAILDDDNICGFDGKFVRTDCMRGLSDCNVKQIIAILKDGDDRHYWGTEEDWKEIQKNALSSDEIDEVREYLRETGQDIGDG